MRVGIEGLKAEVAVSRVVGGHFDRDVVFFFFFFFQLSLGVICRDEPGREMVTWGEMEKIPRQSG